jgi:hypothetical protein
MSFLTKYGTQWGALPMTAGNVWWVAPSDTYSIAGNSYNASDGNNGLSPELAVRRISQAVTNAAADGGDIIALLPGTHTTLSALPVSKAGLTFVGLPYLPSTDDYTIPKTTIVGTGAIGVAVTAANVSFYNIRFLPVTQFQAVTFTTAADNLLFKGCMVDLKTATAHANTKGITGTGATQAPSNLRFLDTYIEQTNGGTSNGYAIDVSAAVNFIVKRAEIVNNGLTASATAWLVACKVNDNASGVFDSVSFRSNNVAVGCAKVIEGVTHTAAGAIEFRRCTSTVNTGNVMFSGFAAADCDLVLNYVGTVAGGTGGTLITATT